MNDNKEDANGATSGPFARVSPESLREMTVVDSDSDVLPPPHEALLADEERLELEASVAQQQTGSRDLEAISRLKLSVPNLQRAQEIRGQFDVSDDPSEVGERMLHELVAGEFAVALELGDIQGAMASLFGKTVLDPQLSVEVAKGFREAVALSSAVRSRMERSLSAAATLRAQRLLLAAQRGRFHV